MNRTDRLYAIVEELRARPTQPTSARRLADRFEVSARTIERDVLALQESGVPIYAEGGRTGGYLLDTTRTLPPVNFSAAEAAAVAVALQHAGTAPLATSARSALTKILAAMSDDDAAAARELGARVLVFRAPSGEKDGRPRSSVVPRVVDQAIVERRVLRVGYRDKTGASTRRAIEPLAVVNVDERWYLSAWCRLRDGVRAFRLDRIEDAVLTREIAPDRDIPPLELGDLEGRPVLE
jgi:predicted DNA-binding transcriptional regulator YafY